MAFRDRSVCLAKFAELFAGPAGATCGETKPLLWRRLLLGDYVSHKSQCNGCCFCEARLPGASESGMNGLIEVTFGVSTVHYYSFGLLSPTGAE